MNTKAKRRFSAWLMLSVFLPMLVFSSLHIHEPSFSPQDCTECVNHAPHGGHVSLNTLEKYDCVLCQFTSLPFLLVVCLAVGVVARVHTAIVSLRPSFGPVVSRRTLSLRAPPVV